MRQTCICRESAWRSMRLTHVGAPSVGWKEAWPDPRSVSLDELREWPGIALLRMSAESRHDPQTRKPEHRARRARVIQTGQRVRKRPRRFSNRPPELVQLFQPGGDSVPTGAS